MSDLDEARYITEATNEFRSALTAVVDGYQREGKVARSLLGDPHTFAVRAIRSAAPIASPWDEIAGPFTRSAGVQQRLGISRQAVAAKAARRRLLRVITADGDHLYPVWQFTDNGVVEGLADLLAMFPEPDVDGWTLAGWLRTPDPDLAEPPLDVLCRGDIASVHAVARSAAARLAA